MGANRTQKKEKQQNKTAHKVAVHAHILGTQAKTARQSVTFYSLYVVGLRAC